MERPMSAFVLSATLHGVVIAVLLLLSYVASQQVQKAPRILELVAGAGDNYGARVAPKLGTPNGVKLDVPTPPQPEPVKEMPPEPAKADLVKPEPPPAPVPVPKKVETVAPTKPPETKAPDFKKQITRQVNRAVTKAKQQVEKERKAEEKRLAEEAKKKAAMMTKEEFDKLNKTKAASAKNPKVARIDAEGIAQGVLDGSTENKTGGAGGKALTNDSDDLSAAWISLLVQRVRTNFEPPPTVGETLAVTISFFSSADGALSNFKVTKSSGSKEFDNAVLAAIRKTQMPFRQDRKSETISLTFNARDLNDK